LWRLRALLDGPGTHLGLTSGEEGDEAEEVVAGADDLVEAGLREPERCEEVAALGGLERRDLGLGGGADHDDRGALFLGMRAQLLDQWVLARLRIGELLLRHVRDVE